MDTVGDVHCGRCAKGRPRGTGRARSRHKARRDRPVHDPPWKGGLQLHKRYRIRGGRLAGILAGAGAAAALVLWGTAHLRSRPAVTAATAAHGTAPGSPAAASKGGATGSVPAVPASPSNPTLPAVQYSPTHPAPAWPGPLPYPILIADSHNARMLEVTPNKQIIWRYPASSTGNGAAAGGVPGDDAFFSPHGGSIVTNDEDGGTILRIGYYNHQVLWHYGIAGKLGNGPGQLNYPDDAYLLPDGNTIVADIRNCRELTISPAGHLVSVWGKPQQGYCTTNPAQGLFGYPNGDTPQPNGDILMTFISGNRVALLSPTGQVIWDVSAPDLYGGYVSDAQLLPDGNVLVCGYGQPGVVVIFDPKTGHVVWMYHVTSGPGELNHPSLALPLPNGNIILNDDRNDRVVVIDPQTNQIVWQYGHTGVAGTAPGYLNIPDGIDVDYWRNWQGWLQQHGTAAPNAASSTSVG